MKRINVTIIAILTLCLTSVCQAGKLKVLYIGLEKSTITKLASEYQKKYKTVTISPIKMAYDEIDNYNYSSKLEQKPDVYIGSSDVMGSMAELPLFADLGKLLLKKTLDDILPSYLDAYSINRKLLAVPMVGYYSVLNYNKKTFSASGISVPKAGWACDKEFYNTCQKLSKDTNGDGVIDQWGIVDLIGSNSSSLIYSYGGTIVDKSYKNITYTQKPALDAINFVLKLHKDRLAEIFDWASYSSTNQPFFNGKSAMKLGLGLAGEAPLMPNAPFVPGIAPIPKGPNGSVPMSYGTVMGVFENSSNKAEAVNFIKYLLSVAGQSLFSKATQCFPVTKSSLNQKNIVSLNRPELLKSYISGRAQSFRKDFVDIESSMWNDVSAMVSGKLTQQQFVERSLINKGKLDNTPYSVYRQ